MADADYTELNALLPWHDPLWSRLVRARQTDRMPHALLLSGHAGLGKRHFALLLGRSLLCRTPDPRGLPCGHCSACILLRAGNHPDLTLCDLEINEKTGKEKSAISIDQIRGLVDFLALKSHYDGYRIVVIDPAERLNPHASNALLKTLEEPPPKTLLILVTAQPTYLPRTILSRCQQLVFRPATAGPALDWLATRLDQRHDPVLLLNLAGGAPLAALALAQGGLDRRQSMLDDLQGLAAGRADPLQVAEEWLKFGVKESLYWLYAWLADMARLQASEDPPAITNPDQRQQLAALAAGIDPRGLFGQIERVAGALRVVDSQLSPQLLLEDSVLGWLSISLKNSR